MLEGFGVVGFGVLCSVYFGWDLDSTIRNRTH